MTEAQALYAFFNSFDIPAYPSTAVPDNAVFPWLTYEYRYDLPFSAPVSIAVQLWYKTDSEAVLNAKVKEIADAIGRSGVLLSHDNGAIWVTAGSPFSVTANTQDNSVKVRQLNINLSFL